MGRDVDARHANDRDTGGHRFGRSCNLGATPRPLRVTTLHTPSKRFGQLNCTLCEALDCREYTHFAASRLTVAGKLFLYPYTSTSWNMFGRNGV